MLRFEVEPGLGPFVPYTYLGAGGYHLQRVGDDPNVYGHTPAIQFGMGMEAAWTGRLAAVAEVRGVGHFTDYLSEQFTFSGAWAFMVGVRWRVIGRPVEANYR